MAAVTDTITCAICQEDILPVVKISKLNCEHHYHQACLQPWVADHNTCPMDRGVIKSINGKPFKPLVQEEVINRRTIVALQINSLPPSLRERINDVDALARGVLIFFPE